MPKEKTAILELRVPMYNGFGSSISNPCVGVAHRKLVYNDKIIIRILKEDKDGNRIFPYDYEMSCAEALMYPTMLLRDGVTPVHVIPISRLTQLLTKTPAKKFKSIARQSQRVAKRMADANIKATIEPTWD